MVASPHPAITGTVRKELSLRMPVVLIGIASACIMLDEYWSTSLKVHPLHCPMFRPHSGGWLDSPALPTGLGPTRGSFLRTVRWRPADASSQAIRALGTIGFRSPEFLPNLSFHDLFHDVEKPEIRWTPNEMQQKAFAAVNAPGVYIIEAPMGMGKTEAALGAAYRLMVSGKARRNLLRPSNPGNEQPDAPTHECIPATHRPDKRQCKSPDS